MRPGHEAPEHQTKLLELAMLDAFNEAGARSPGTQG